MEPIASTAASQYGAGTFPPSKCKGICKTCLSFMLDVNSDMRESCITYLGSMKNFPSSI
jgi:hypothetical protein